VPDGDSVYAWAVFLSRLERNELLEAVREAGTDPRDLEPFIDDERLRFRDRSTGSYFEMHDTPAGRVIKLKIGDAREGTQEAGSIRQVSESLEIWIKMVENFREAPDLWAELEAERSLGELAQGQENTPFTAAEQQQIATIVAQVLEQAKETWALPEAEFNGLETTLNYAADAATWIRGRIDWVNLVAGVIVNKAAEGLLAVGTTRLLLHALANGVGPLFGHPMPLLSP
jgi:hypothetical protein